MLGESLSAYKVIIILVSHDRHLLSKVSDRVIILENGEAKFFPEGYNRYSIKIENANLYEKL